MKELYFVVGFLVTWAGILFVILWIGWWLFDLAKLYFYNTWVGQVYEYIRFKKKFNELKANNFKDVNWAVVNVHHSRLLGQSPEFAYKSRHLFRKKLLAMFEEMFKSEPAAKWLAQTDDDC